MSGSSTNFFTTQDRIDFVIEVERLIESEGKTVEEAVALAKGHGTVEEYLTWRGLVKYTRPVRHKFASGNKKFDGVVNALEHLMATGFFFICLGLLMLLWAIELYGTRAPAFIFILTVLGCASFLYGTGTQVIGRVVSPKYAIGFWGTFSIFGGAALLAFGIGCLIAKWPSEIRTAFLPQVQYAKLTVVANVNGEKVNSNTPVRVRIAGGQWLPAYTDDGTIHVLFPRHFDKVFCKDYLEFSAEDSSGQRFFGTQYELMVVEPGKGKCQEPYGRTAAGAKPDTSETTHALKKMPEPDGSDNPEFQSASLDSVLTLNDPEQPILAETRSQVPDLPETMQEGQKIDNAIFQ